MQLVMKDQPAILANGSRSIHGYFDQGDITHLEAAYPRVGGKVIAKIANAINAPRLLEVATVLEVVQRYLEGSFSVIKDLSVKAVANPLSILFWDNEERRVRRIKTQESELMHGACEKLALRTNGVQKVNNILDEAFGLQIAFGCSCCAIAVASQDAPELFSSDYYRLRETYGRLFDSDVLCVTGDLMSAGSVTDVPKRYFDYSADFHQEEVESYVRFAVVTNQVIAANPVSPRIEPGAELVQFLTGKIATLN